MKFPKKKEKSEAKANAKWAGWNRPALSSASERKEKEKTEKERCAASLKDHNPNRMLKTHAPENFKMNRWTRQGLAGGGRRRNRFSLGEEGWKFCPTLEGCLWLVLVGSGGPEVRWKRPEDHSS